ncbi:MAG: hypothetical protein D6738_06720 [Acidobacteria bacterium]|nr:MAG: hypothetical protein D6738_06720 [Acidobacteriota bacterium]
MRRLLYPALPLGLALLVIGSGWLALAPRVAPVGYRSLIVAGALLAAAGWWWRRRETPGGADTRAIRFGASAAASIFLAICILLLVNFLSARFHERWDLTRTRSFSLHPATVRVLESIDRDVDVYALISSRERLGRMRAVRSLYEIFAFHQPRISVEVFDPNLRPDLVEKLGVRGIDLTVVIAGDRKVVFPGFEEADLAAALREVSREKPKVVYWVTGDGERALDEGGGVGFNRFRRELAREFYEVRELNLGPGERVPDDAALLVFADPRRPIAESVGRIYQQWLRGGGRALILTDVDLDQRSGEPHPADYLLGRWGLRALPAFLVDPRQRTGETDPRVVVGDEFGRHESVAAMNGLRVVFRLARPLEFFENPDDRQIFHQILVRVGSSASDPSREPYVETDLSRAAGTVEIDREAQREWAGRSKTVALLAFRRFEPAPGTDEEGREARVVLVGDTDFLTDGEIDREANAELGLNLVRYLTGEELLIRREGEQRYAKQAMALEPNQIALVRMLALIVPAGVFLFGWIVWFLRRSK